MPLHFRREVLERARLDAGLSRDKLAQLADVGRVTVYMVESGKTSPRPETVKAFADALGLPVAELYAETPDLDGVA